MPSGTVFFGPAPDANGTGNDDESWQNGNLNEQQAHYYEGEAVPYRAVIDDLENGVTYSLRIQWDTVDNGKYALDYLTSYDFSFPAGGVEPVPNPLTGVTDLSGTGTSPILLGIPGDPQLLTGFNAGTTSGLGSTQPDGLQFFSIYGTVSNLSASGYTYEVTSGGILNKASITVNFSFRSTHSATTSAAARTIQISLAG